MSPTMETRRVREAAVAAAVRAATARGVARELPDLSGSDARAVRMGGLVRDRALTLIERDLVHLEYERRARAPFSDEWAVDWWEQTVLPSARARTTAAWWIRRAPRTGLEWAKLLTGDELA